MNKLRVLGIAPYEGMKNLMQTIAVEHPNISLTVEVADLEEGLKVMERYRNQFDVIISRGATAKLLRSLSVPVIETDISTYDILNALELADCSNNRIALVSFSDMARTTQQLCNLLNYNIDIYTIAQVDEITPTLNLIKDKNYDTILCGNIVNLTAKRLGMNSFLITSGSESIKRAFDQAELLYSFKKSLNESASAVSGVRILDKTEAQQFFDSSIYSYSGLINSYRKIINSANILNSHILISGEFGTGKEVLAYLIYLHSNLADRPLCMINFELMNEHDFQELLSNRLVSETNKASTILLMNLDALNRNECLQLNDAIRQNALFSGSRIILCATVRQDSGYSENTSIIKNTLNCTVIHIEPLRHSPQKINALINKTLNQISEKHPHNIVFVEPGAAALLQNYSWPQNLLQFNNVIASIALETNGSRVTEATVRNILSREPVDSSDEDKFMTIDPHKTLNSINVDIANEVVKKCGGNQTKAAQSLGISRTTLWRLIKQGETL